MQKDEFKDNIKKIATEVKQVAGDASVVAFDAIKRGSEELVIQGKKAKINLDTKMFNPVFASDYASGYSSLPRMIRVFDEDKLMGKEAFTNAIGYLTSSKGMEVLNLCEKYAKDIKKSFYPVLDEGFYFVDPVNPDLYINLNDYFDYMKSAKVEELNQIAQSLGASYIKISLKAQKKKFVKKNADGKIKVKAIGKADIDHEFLEDAFENVEIESETTFKGHTYQEPIVKYFKDERKIEALIEARRDVHNPIKKKTLVFKYNSSSGIKQKDVAGIDAAINKLDLGGNASIASEIQNESRTYFEYVVEFPD